MPSYGASQALLEVKVLSKSVWLALDTFLQGQLQVKDRNYLGLWKPAAQLA